MKAHLLALGLLLASELLPLTPAAPGREAPARRPNIIFILADDLGHGDLGCYGQRRIKTPCLDRLALDGMRFTQCYAGSTVCAPSRCCLMIGKHTGHAVVRGNYWEFHERGSQLAVRMGKWKAIRPALLAPLKLYDLSTDLHEDHDVAAQNPEVVAHVEDYLKTVRSESKDFPLQEPPGRRKKS